jgi:hypothetical protein
MLNQVALQQLIQDENGLHESIEKATSPSGAGAGRQAKSYVTRCGLESLMGQ